MPDTPGVVLVVPLLGMPEVAEGDDLAALLLRACAHTGLRLQPGDVVVVSSKIASKSLGLWASDREDAVAASTGRVVAERALLDGPAVGGPAPSGTAPPGPPSSSPASGGA
ncbi:coenzyme F420-0:L-glutamate ligase, partial [Nostocoides japonicum]|uniref:coenzyme F420-0:L-glutamate ligase n=1 Tax=Nostocoides japonicum TaxID=99481 RepID=UPI00065B8CF1